MKASLLFEVLPYLAFAMLVGGFAVRYLLSRPYAATKADAANAGAMVAGNRIGGIGFVAVLVLHLLAIAAPRSILHWNEVPLRLYLLEGSGFLFGCLAVGAWTNAMRQHFARPCPSILRACGDAVFLALVFVALATGILSQALYRWGSSWAAATLTPYVLSVLHGRPAVGLVEHLPFLVRLHVVSFFGILAALPFTTPASALIARIDRTVTRLGMPLRRAIRVAGAWIRARGAAWIWPEENEPPALIPATIHLPDRRVSSRPPPASERRRTKRSPPEDPDARHDNLSHAR